MNNTVYQVPSGMPLSIWQSKYSRKDPVTGRYETWAERIEEVIAGNFMLDPRGVSGYPEVSDDYRETMQLGRAGIFATSGRHLQHGDITQPGKQLEFFSNCTTSAFSFELFRHLLKGAGVGRDYSTASCRTDWANMPDVRLTLDDSHPDFKPEMFRGSFEPLREAQHKYDSESERVRWFTVDDSREGWSKIVEILETAAFHQIHADKLFIFDFSNVRAAGQPIKGLQNRPASGPIPLMNAVAACHSIKAAGMKPWKQALFIDHYFASCVQLGGARRSARMATKSWRDADIMEFIDIKRGGHLWTANNSILVDAEFWEHARQPQHSKARRIFEAATNAAYYDKTGEPGLINIDRLTDNREGIDDITGANCIDPTVYTDLHPRTMDMIDNVLGHLKRQKYVSTTNPCGEIVLSSYGGYCCIGDVDLSKVTDLDDALSAVGLMAKFLIRVNLMRCEYSAETKRTNRIGVCLTGIHEFAWNMFGLNFRDMIYDGPGAAPYAGRNLDTCKFWDFISDLRLRAEHDAATFATEIGANVPHTVTSIKPSGTISKVLACTEGAHLPARAYYLRWVQYKVDDPTLDSLRLAGYPVKDVSHRYPDHWVVGFPTCQPLAQFMGEQVVTAEEATMEEHFRWLRLLEDHWLGPVGCNNQISYTMPINTNKVSFQEFQATILKWQPEVRCCATMPVSDWEESVKTYSYVPEQPITKHEYEQWMTHIKVRTNVEDFTDDELMCAGGACPIEPDIN